MSKLPFESEVITGMSEEEFEKLKAIAEEIYGKPITEDYND